MIHRDLAGIADRIGARPGTYRAPCPHCDRGGADRALAVTVEHDGASVWICHRCHWTGCNRSDSLGEPVARPTRSAQPQRPPDAALALYRAARAIQPETVAAEYLLARGCVLPPNDGDLRWHPNVKHMSGHTGPALVALVTHAETGEPLSVHRTWIDPAKRGCKAEIDPPRTYWPRLPTKGGCVRLWPNDSVTMGLGIAEGIETALALAHAHTPVWACLDAGHMADVPVLDGIEILMIAADHDEAGLRAAQSCANRWHGAGAEVRIVIPTNAGRDLADEAAV